MTAAEEDGNREEVASAAAYLGAQLAAEKIPANFLLFTEEHRFALAVVVLTATRSSGGCIPPGTILIGQQ
jgi:hypothetical protein